MPYVETMKLLDFSHLMKFNNQIPKKYTENVRQEEIDFVYIPKPMLTKFCQNVPESDSLFLIKTSRNSVQEKFLKLRPLFIIHLITSCS